MSDALMWAQTVTSHDAVYAPYGDGRTATIDPAISPKPPPSPSPAPVFVGGG